MCMTALTDEELVFRHRAGDLDAFPVLVSRYVNPLYRFLLHVCGDPEQAKDLTQVTCLKAWKHIRTFQVHRCFKTWVFTIARNTAMDFLKKKKAIPFSHMNEDAIEGEPTFEENIEDANPLPSILLERAESALHVDRALQRISEHHRTVLLLHEGENMTFQEIAETLCEPLNTIKSRYRRALILLRHLLEEEP